MLRLKDIRIFVASSRELERVRNYLAFLALVQEDEFAARGFRVRLAKWEYVDPKMTAERTEDWCSEEALVVRDHGTLVRGCVDPRWAYYSVLNTRISTLKSDIKKGATSYEK